MLLTAAMACPRKMFAALIRAGEWDGSPTGNDSITAIAPSLCKDVGRMLSRSHRRRLASPHRWLAQGPWRASTLHSWELARYRSRGLAAWQT